ncbi:helicase-associated domain-containing protein [Sphaerisporangium rufum]|nr:helicase-associated domain-containing protein [Sphaerisporangium rufum]
MDDHLLDWLTTLDEDRLARVLATRPDAIAAPWPRRLDTLARRLGDDFAVMEVMRGLPLPSLEILQARLVLGDRATADGLARFLGVTPAGLLPWLDGLQDHALAWPGRDGHLRVAGAVSRWWTAPCGLGEPLGAYLDSWTMNTEGLRRMCRTLGLAAHGGRRQLAGRLAGLLGDADRLAALLADAPEGTVSLLDEFAWDGPVRGVDGNRFLAAGTPERWAADRGLLYRTQWDIAEMPREVALALRGPDYHPAFTPEPPRLGAVPVDDEATGHALRLAAPRVLDRAAALLENLDKTPLPLLKGGGVGVREVRRIVRETACTEEETRLLLEICAVARLLAFDEAAKGLIPTKRFDVWRLEDAPSRLRVLLAAWWRMERSSLRRAAGRYPTVLGDDPAGETVARVRRAVLATLATLPAGTAVASTPELLQAVRWRSPLLDGGLVADCGPAVLAEARLLALVSGDALTDLGRALAGVGAPAGDEQDESVPEVERDPGLVEASARALAGARRTALFGADLTAVVTGPPAAELSGLLDRAADRESEGTASVWRFTPASVRRALDAGHTADGLLDELRAAGGVPQALAYLVRDVARRHGEVTVSTVGCIVQGSDPVLLAEIAAHRRLSRLGLRLLAPTVLAATAPADRTLAALRDAGYAPLPVDDTGAIAVRREPSGGRLIVLPGGRVAELEEPPPVFETAPDPREHARRLVRTRGEEPQPGQTWAVIGRLATRLPTAQQSLLGFVVDRGVRALITLADGLTATVSHGELRRGVLDAWCEEAGDYLEFPLAEIASVTSG